MSYRLTWFHAVKAASLHGPLRWSANVDSLSRIPSVSHWLSDTRISPWPQLPGRTCAIYSWGWSAGSQMIEAFAMENDIIPMESLIWPMKRSRVLLSVYRSNNDDNNNNIIVISIPPQCTAWTKGKKFTNLKMMRKTHSRVLTKCPWPFIKHISV